MNRIEIIKHYDRLADQGNDPVHDPEMLKAYMDKWDGQQFLDSMELDETKDVLEIGVGTGRLAVRVVPHCGSFTGIDLSAKTVRLAKENLAGEGNVKLICGDFCTYDFGVLYDVIYSSLTFMHIEDKQAAVDRVSALLASGGRFVLSIDKDQSGIIDVGDSKITVYPDDPGNMRKYITAAGLTVLDHIETEFAHIFVAEKSN